MIKIPKIPKYPGPHPCMNGEPVKYYVHYDEETNQSYLTEALPDGGERFCNWLPPSFGKCIEDRIKKGKFGYVKTYRL